MYLAEVHIENFRSFKSLDVKLHPGLNVIVGENNVGKTTVLDAIRIALGPASAGPDVTRITRDDRHRQADGQQTGDPIRIDLTFRGLNDADRAEFMDILNYDSDNPANSTASIHFEWSWPDDAKRWHQRRYGGGRSNTDAAVPDEVLQAIPTTLLGALRDAVVALSPGRTSRLGQLLDASATTPEREKVVAIFEAANKQLEHNSLITSVEKKIRGALRAATGPHFSQDAAIRASEHDFDKIANTLRIVLRWPSVHSQDAEPSQVFTELRSNGLGFNNLLYVATVLAELEAREDASLPLMLVEEPEAHLHPQLQTLLADHLATGATSGTHQARVQTIVTTHSPTLAAHVAPDLIHVLHREGDVDARCVPIRSCGLAADEVDQLRRMLDVTKATMLFARGVILVEGISEALLLPVLARRSGINLAEHGVSVVPIAGVDFGTIAKLFGPKRLRVPVAIVTDGDPGVEGEGDQRRPKTKGSGYVRCDRLVGLLKQFETNDMVKCFASKVTLEFDLAEADHGNADVIFDAWKSCYERGPRSLTKKQLDDASLNEERATLLWRALCLGDPSHGKAELAQRLASKLDAKATDGTYVIPKFIVPSYISHAIDHAK